MLFTFYTFTESSIRSAAVASSRQHLFDEAAIDAAVAVALQLSSHSASAETILKVRRWKAFIAWFTAL